MMGLCISFPAYFQAQPNSYHFKKIGVESGLSHPSVTSIIQDTAGYLWLSTQFGLNRYDGRRFDVFTQTFQSKSGLQSSLIQGVYQDSRGRIWVGTRTKGLHRFLPETETFRHYSIPHKGERIMDAPIILEDSFNTLYIGTNRKGVFYLDATRDSLISLENYPGFPSRLRNTQIFAMFEDRQQKLWIGTKKMGIFILHRDRKTWEEIPSLTSNPRLEGTQNIRSFFQDKAGNMWVGTERGIYIQNGSSENFVHLEVPDVTEPIRGDVYIRCMYQDRKGYIWVGTEGGLFVLNMSDSSFTTFLNDPNFQGSISNNTITCILEDESGVLWVGTDNGGLNLLEDRQNPFHYYGFEAYSKEKPLNLPAVRTLTQTAGGQFLIGSNAAGLRFCDSSYKNCTSIYSTHPEIPEVFEDKIYDTHRDKKGKLWIGGIRHQLYQYFPKENRLKPYTFSPCETEEEPHDNSLGINYLDFYQDPEGGLWVCLLTEGETFNNDPLVGGILKYSPEKDSFICWTEEVLYADKIPLQNVYTMAIQDSVYWIGTPEGLYSLNIKNGDIQHFQADPHNPKGLNNAHIRRLYLDDQGILWIGSLQYLNSLNTHTGEWNRYVDRNRWLEGGVMAFEGDNDGNLWISTQQGLIKKNPKNAFTNYSGSDGLMPLQEFTMYTSYKNPNTGKIFFGGASGFIGFQPKDIKESTFEPRMSISRLTALRDEKSGESYKRTEYTLINKNSIELSHLDRILNFEISALNFYKGSKNQFKYRLIGFQEEWVELGNENKFTLTNLDYGTYWLEVMGSNNDGLWNPKPKRFKITILAPWWLQNWAIAIYSILLAYMLIGVYSLYKQREKKRIQRKQKELELENLKKLDKLRSQFFTNISHEFRTPLTLIEGPALEYLQRVETEGSIKLGKMHGKRFLEQILYNCSKLLRSINQLMKLSQIEAGTLSLEVSKQNLGSILQRFFAQFESLSERKNIRFELKAPQNDLEVYVDVEKFDIILQNLLGNAFKFTPTFGIVELRVIPTDHFLKIEVFNSDSFIPAEDLDKIFGRFYQSHFSNASVSEGTGIGLALVKELVELHRGQVSVESHKSQGTTFTVFLRRGKAHFSPEEITIQHISPVKKPVIYPESILLDSSHQSTGIAKRRVLIVEDNESMRDFLYQILHPTYEILQSENGKDGWHKIVKEMPDLVISDVMMPKMEGTALCEKVKSDSRTKHIPIILLTAKEDKSDRLKGLSAGANLYMGKPFLPEELRLNILNLLNQNQNVTGFRDRYISPEDVLDTSKESSLGERTYTSRKEQDFLKEVIKHIEQNLDNSSFGVEELGQSLGISRVHLYRKIKKITGTGPNELILDIRIRYAKELLNSTSKQISEIAYLVGFSSPSHFSERFKKREGIGPKAFRNG